MIYISSLQPNTRCRNQDCKRGSDGQRSFYYSCKFCAREASWKSLACCFECFEAYTKQVEEIRAKKKNISITPERTDMTKSQYNALMETPVEQIKEETIKEIADAGYGEELETVGLAKTLEKINEDIRETNSENIDNPISEEIAEQSFKSRRSRRNKFN